MYDLFWVILIEGPIYFIKQFVLLGHCYHREGGLIDKLSTIFCKYFVLPGCAYDLGVCQEDEICVDGELV